MGELFERSSGSASTKVRSSRWLNVGLVAMGVVAAGAGCGDASKSGGTSEGGTTAAGGVHSGGAAWNGGRASGGASTASSGASAGGVATTSGGAGATSGGSSEAGANAGAAGFPEGGSAVVRGGAGGTTGGTASCNPALAPAGPDSNGGAGDEATCGKPGDVIAAGMTLESMMAVPTPELEPLRGCRHFRGSLQLYGLDRPGALDALATLEEIDGSLLLVVMPSDLGALQRLRRVRGKFIDYDVYEVPHRLESLESVGDLWLYQGSVESLDWLPRLARIESSFIARRNLRIPAKALEDFASERVVCGAKVSLTDSVPPETHSADADAVLCGEPNVQISATDPSLVGCTRLLGSIHLPDVSSPGQIRNLSSLVQIDGSLTLFRNHTPDFSPLGNLRRVGAKFQPHGMDGPTLKGFEKLEEVGELNITRPLGELSDLDWLPALTKVRESAFIERGETPSEAAVNALISRLDVGGQIVLRSP